MVLLEAQQVLAGHAEQEMVSGLQFSVRQRREQPFAASLQFKNVHIEASLQTTVQKGPSHQFRVNRNGDLRAVTAAFWRVQQFVGVTATIRQQKPWCQDQVERSGEPDRDADQREAEQTE